MARANRVENLIPQSERDAEGRRKVAIMGGVASGIARREKRRTLDIIEKYLAGKEKIGGEDMPREDALALNTIRKAINRGDWKMLEFIAKLRGELVERAEVEYSGGIPAVLTDADVIEDGKPKRIGRPKKTK